MRFSTRSEYGIRVMVRMGRGYGNGPLPLAELAEQEGLPLSYLEQIAEAASADCPILGRRVNGKPLIYLDSAATSQKPAVVIDTMDDYYRRYNANPHRGVYAISEEATAAYESARQRVATFINAASP